MTGWSPSNPLCLAIDRPDLAGALALVQELRDTVGMLKLGLEFFAANGPDGVRAVARAGLPLFLDLKLHDIPNTVAGAVRALAPLPITLLTVHAAGGRAMLEAAVRARDATHGQFKLLAVTVLTSLADADLSELGIMRAPREQVLALAELAVRSGIDGLVCAPPEIAALRQRFGPAPLIVVPGIRPAARPDDQKRTLDPRRAYELGADVLVVGRPITDSPDPRAAAQAILAALAGSNRS